MIDSLSETSLLYYFILNHFTLPISVVSKSENGELSTQFKFNLPLGGRSHSIKDKFSSLPESKLSESGVYLFRHLSGKFALGSAMNFKNRLKDHLNSFNGHRTMQKIHLFTKLNGGLQSLTWSPLVITPNFYKLFTSIYPNHVLTKGELDVLSALTQFMPRILEQSFVSHYKPELNGGKKGVYSVIFNFTAWSLSDKANLYTKPLSSLFKAVDDKKNIVASAHFMNSLASKLGLSLAGLKYHLNKESKVYSKYFGLSVTVYEEGKKTEGHPMDLYKSPKIRRKELKLKDISLSSLESGNIYVYKLDKQTVLIKHPTAPGIFKLINPEFSLNLNNKTLKSKVDNMATYINKELSYSSELGNFYLAKNPSYSVNAKSPIIIINLETKLATFSNSKRECTRLLSQLLNINIQLSTLVRNNWIDSGNIIHEKIMLVTKIKFISIVPEAVDFNSGSIGLKSEKINLLKYKLLFS